MRKLVMLVGALALSNALAATTYVQNGLTYVNLSEFAAENKVSVTNDYGDITLSKDKIFVHLADNPAATTINGQVTPFSAAATNIAGNIVVPLIDLQKAFGPKMAESVSTISPVVSPPATQDTPPPLIARTPPKPAAVSQAPMVPHLNFGRGTCGTLKTYDAVDGNPLAFDYTIPAQFPKPAKYETLAAPFWFMCNDSVAIADENILKITSKSSIADAWKVIDPTAHGFTLDEGHWYDYPALKIGFHYANISLIPKGNYFVSGSVKEISLKTIGYKVDGGPLRPIFFEGKFYSVKIPAKHQIDIYVTDNSQNRSTHFQRLSINPQAKTITIYKKYPFPKS